MNTTSTDNLASSSTISWFKGLVAPLLILFFAFTGQWLFTRQDPNYWAGFLSYAISLVLFLLILLDWPPAQLPQPAAAPIFRRLSPITGKAHWRLIYLLGTIILAALAFIGFTGNSLMGGFWPWLTAVLLFLVAFAEIPDSEGQDLKLSLRAWWLEGDKRVLLVLLLIILLAVFFRAYRLAELPAEMTSDHAEKLLDVQDILDGQRPIFLPRNTGREAVQFYLTALLIRFTPLTTSHLALKVGTAIIGIIAIPFTYLLGKEFYGRFAGLLAAFFLATSHWHVAITRVGLRFPFTAAFATPALYFLFRAFRANRRNDWLAAALFLGIGLHTYTAIRIVPLLLIALIGLKLILDGWQILRKQPLPGPNPYTTAFLQNALLAGFFTTLLFLPLSRVIIDDPEAFWLRTLTRAHTASPVSAGKLFLVFLNNIKNALLMFNIKGDIVAVNTIPGSPVLGPVAAALFLLGIFFLIVRLIPRPDRRSLYILTTLFFLLLPSILSLAYPQENPSVVRTGGAVPWVMLVAALPLVLITTRIRELPRKIGNLAAGIVITVLAVIAVLYNYNWYFIQYDANIRRSLWNSSEMGLVLHDFVESGGEWTNAFHIPYPHWVDTRNIGINAGNIRWANAILADGWYGHDSIPPGPKLFLLFPEDVESMRRLLWLYPRGQIELYDSRWEGKDFIIYRAP